MWVEIDIFYLVVTISKSFEMSKPKTKRVKSLSEQCLHTLVKQLAKYDPDVQVNATTSSNQVEAGDVGFTSKYVNPFNEWRKLLQ